MNNGFSRNDVTLYAWSRILKECYSMSEMKSRLSYAQRRSTTAVFFGESQGPTVRAASTSVRDGRPCRSLEVHRSLIKCKQAKCVPPVYLMDLVFGTDSYL